MNRAAGLSLLIEVLPAGICDECDAVFADSPDTYNFKCLQLYQQPSVIARLVNADIRPADLAEPVEQWDPIEWELVVVKQQMQVNSATEFDANKSIFTVYTCKKCKENRTTIKFLQTRCSDEPISIFVTCVGCGFEWRRG
jgi:DNA-directed RNA polymerase subunit M/transcription elongation factor TFIIS